MCQGCVASPDFSTDIKEALQKAVDTYNTSERTQVEQLVTQMQENIRRALESGEEVNEQEIIKENLSLINELGLIDGDVVSEDELMTFINRAREARGSSPGTVAAQVEIMMMVQKKPTVEMDQEEWPDDVSDQLLRGVFHYMVYHYSMWEIIHPFLSEKLVETLKLLIENYAEQIIDRLQEDGAVIVMNRSALMSHLIGSMTVSTFEGMMYGYYAGTSAQECLLGELHDHQHGVFTSPEEESLEDFHKRLQTVADLAHAIASSKDGEKEAS